MSWVPLSISIYATIFSSVSYVMAPAEAFRHETPARRFASSPPPPRVPIDRCGYDGGLVIAPANVIMYDTPVENVLAMYEAAGGLAPSGEGATEIGMRFEA